MIFAQLEIRNGFDIVARDRLENFLRKHKKRAKGISLEYIFNNTPFRDVLWTTIDIVVAVIRCCGTKISSKISFSLDDAVKDGENMIILRLMDKEITYK